MLMKTLLIAATHDARRHRRLRPDRSATAAHRAGAADGRRRHDPRRSRRARCAIISRASTPTRTVRSRPPKLAPIMARWSATRWPKAASPTSWSASMRCATPTPRSTGSTRTRTARSAATSLRRAAKCGSRSASSGARSSRKPARTGSSAPCACTAWAAWAVRRMIVMADTDKDGRITLSEAETDGAAAFRPDGLQP